MKGKPNDSFDPNHGKKTEAKPDAKVNGASGDVICDDKTGEIKATVEERQAEVAAAKAERDEKLADRLDGVAAEMAATLPAFLPKCNGLVGDVQKAMVEFGKRFFPGWNAMTEDQQNAAIRHTGDMATNLVSKTINIMAPCSFPFYEIDIPKYTVDRDKRLIGANYTVSIDAYEDLRRYKNWIAVPRDVANFYDKGKVIKSDKIGTLGLTEPVQMRKDEEPAPLASTDPPPPASGPGTPTDPDVMDAVGKGLAAAEAVEAGTQKPATTGL